MPSVDELKKSTAGAFDAYIGELKLAGSSWERKPATAKEGEDAWCARQVAEHIATAGGFFAAAIARVIGVPSAPSSPVSLADVEDALVRTPAEHQKLLDVLVQVRDSHLALETEFGPLGKTTLAHVIAVVPHHLGDHTEQLRSLRGG